MVKIDASADLDWTNLPPQQRLGTIIGGKYLEEAHFDESSAMFTERPLTKVECDIPLTYTESVEKDGKEWVMLTFAPADQEDPFNWPLKRKWFFTSLLCAMTLFIGCATTVYSSTIGRMTAHFNRVTEIGQLGLFTFNQTCALAPLFLAPFCELVGRQVVYVGAYLCFCLCFIGLALGQNIATILVLRTLLGLFGCVGTILVGGTFDDMFIPEQRAIPMSLFSYIAILGTVGAPIYAGFVDENVGWRWTEGIQGLANLPLLVVICLFFKETRGGVTLQKRAKLLRKDTGDDRWVSKEELEAPGLKDALYNSSVKAIQMLATEPVVFFFGLWIAFAWFITFLFLSVISITFSDGKHWAEGIAGLPYIGLVIGCSLGFAANFLQIRKYTNLRAKSNGPLPPENRLYGAMCGALFLPVGLFIYSFTQYPELHWMGPMVGLVCICFGIFFIFESCYSYTSDCYGQSASSAIAGQGFMRNTLGAVSPLFAGQFFRNVHSQYAGLICAVVATALTFLPYILYKFGPVIRAKSKRAIVYPAENGEIEEQPEDGEGDQTPPDYSDKESSTPSEKGRGADDEEAHVENANNTTNYDEKNKHGAAELHSSSDENSHTEDEVEDALQIEHADNN
uniref:Fructose facilitator n=2 Tax=Zygosaccharomyces TaxID=4953 RepID=A0A0P0J2N6_9SACH|nr:fructose facilitator [Zygosaccharomyces kombuchaensis]